MLKFSAIEFRNLIVTQTGPAHSRHPLTALRRQSLVLIGPTGAGKTTIGRKLAHFLHLPFYDVDEELEKSTGVSVNLIFDIEKESGFRQRESRMLEALLKRPAAVIATGGGVVVTENNRQLLKNHPALVIYLQTSVERQLQRLSHDKRRPLLQVPDREHRLQEMARIRNPLYESVSDLTITTGNGSPQRMAREVLEQLKAAVAKQAKKQRP